MRLNKYIAQSTGLSRRAADEVIAEGRVAVEGDTVKLDGEILSPAKIITIALNKPVGYVCSRAGQGSKTIYDLLPKNLHHLNPVGRLDKNSSGLLLLTNDGKLANELTHPRYEKEKVYLVKLNKNLSKNDVQKLTQGVKLDDGLSKFARLVSISESEFEITMQEGRNRQIRRTFAALGYDVINLRRNKFGSYALGSLKTGTFKQI